MKRTLQNKWPYSPRWRDAVKYNKWELSKYNKWELSKYNKWELSKYNK